MRHGPGALTTSIVMLQLALVGCTDGSGPVSAPVTSVATPAASAGTEATVPTPTPTPTPTPASAPTPTPSPTAVAVTEAELAAAGVNELGRVLVGEWHIIGDTDGEYRTSRETLRAQLQELYDRGYRPVTQTELLDGTLPVPFGTTPVLLTFDDSTRGHIALDEDGTPTADSAVGIIEAFAADHEGWRATAVFAYNFPDPFGDADVEPRLRWLVENGYELSNHTVGHTNLGSLSSAEVAATLAENQARLRAVVPDAQVLSLTLPFGAWPDDRAAAASGSADGTSYEHRLIYLVGSDPNRSPHHVDFDPLAVQRVPAHAVVGTGPEWFGDWLDRMDRESLRFISDGDARLVTYPAALADVAAVHPTLPTRVYGEP